MFNIGLVSVLFVSVCEPSNVTAPISAEIYDPICAAVTFFSTPPSEIANKSPSTIVIPDPSVIASMFRIAETSPNSIALPAEFTFRTCPTPPILRLAPSPP